MRRMEFVEISCIFLVLLLLARIPVFGHLDELLAMERPIFVSSSCLVFSLPGCFVITGFFQIV